LGNVLVSAVHQRKRDLAVLKVLGFNRRQLHTAIAVQASTFLAVALLLAVPLGLLVGSALWGRRARDLGIVVERQVPWSGLAAVAIVAFLVANAMAAILARAAARVRPGPALASE
jgi:putative ABC transport system permease protein